MGRRFGGVPQKGMLIVLIIPWWGFIVAVILVATGGFLLFSDC